MKARFGLITGIILFGAAFLHAQGDFQISYSTSGDEVMEWVIPSNDGNLVLAGNTNTFDPNGDGLIMKTDLHGNIIWSKILGGSALDVIEKIIPCAEGGYVAIGYTSSYSQGNWDAWIIRIDENGEVIWSDCFGTYYKDNARGIIQTKDGGFVIVGQEDDFDYAFILALNSNGELLWEKEFYLDIVTWFNYICETEDGRFLFTGALNYNGFGIHDAFIMETDSTGNIIRNKVYGGQDNDSFRPLFPYQDGFLVVGDTWSWQHHQLGWVAKLNSDLVVEKAVVLGDDNSNQYLESACFISNSIYVVLKLTNSNSYIVELDSSLALKQSWQFNPGYSSYSSHIINLEDSSLIFSGSVTDNQTLRKDVYLTKFYPGDSTYACNTVPHSTFIDDIHIQSDDLYFYETDDIGTFQQVTIESSDISLQSQYLCSSTPVADFSSPDQACDNYPVSMINNSQYGETYQWFFEGAIPASSDSIDPGIIAYENPGYYYIKLVVSNEIGKDSLIRYITVKHAPEVFLGVDTNLQGNQQLILDAGPDMDHYLWQDGSCKQTLEVSESGIYWVIVQKEFCYSSDTILVTNESTHADIVIYPNPASGFVQITSKSREVPASVIIFNQSGSMLTNLHPSGNVIDISNLEPGFYYMELIFREYNVKRRLIIIY